VAVDLARELGKRLDLIVELVGFESAGRMVAGLKTGAWDIAFLAIDAERASEIDFTAPYIEIEGTYVVPPGSPLRTVEDVDRDGVRIGVSANSAYDLFLKRSVKHATLVRAPDPKEAFALLLARSVDVVAGVKQSLIANAEKLPGSRVLPGRFMAIQQALGIPKGHDEAAQYLREFIDHVKASGVVARAIQNAGVRGVSVPPPQS
jgi:polar amino acid transport system substrate-binding protein